MKSRVLAAVFAVVLTAGTLTGCGSTKTADTAKTEDTKEETSSDKEVTQEPVSEEEAEADGFSTSPCKRRFICRPLPTSFRISFSTRFCAPVSWKGSFFV